MTTDKALQTTAQTHEGVDAVPEVTSAEALAANEQTAAAAQENFAGQEFPAPQPSPAPQAATDANAPAAAATPPPAPQAAAPQQPQPGAYAYGAQGYGAAPTYGAPGYGVPYGVPPAGQYPPGAYGVPGYAAPQYGAPQYGAPPYAPHPYAQPNAPYYAAPPQYGAPQCGPAQYGAPQYGMPPQYGAPRSGKLPAYVRVDGTTTRPKADARRARLPLMVCGICILLALAAVFGTALWKESQRPPAIDPANIPSFAINELPENLDDGLSAAEIAKRVNPSVVCVDVAIMNGLPPVPSGSGILMNGDGYIITNAHVVEDVLGMAVTLADGRTFDAILIGADARTDLAVLKITGEDLPVPDFGDSTQLQVGERVIAIGNAAGEYSGSITQGIISGLNRKLEFENGMGNSENLIQTDAAINPGNSGGALVNRFGQIIGINSAKIAGSAYEGMGFAIPIDAVKPVVEELIANGFVERAALGVTVSPLSGFLSELEGEPATGLYIESVSERSDLVNYDVVPGDIILRANGKELVETADLTGELTGYKPGDTIELEIEKGGSKKIITVTVTLISSTPE